MEGTPLENRKDGVLAIAAGLGDLEAFGELVRRYRRAVVRIAAAIAGPEDAEDVAQETLLLAFKALPDLDEPQHFAAWLSAIARNRAIRWSKHERRGFQVSFEDGLQTRLERIAAADTRGREAATELRDAIDVLPEGCRMIMRLRWLDEMPMQDIARFTGLPLSTVKWRLHEGKRQLREWSQTATCSQRKSIKGEVEHGETKRKYREPGSTPALKRAAPHGPDRADESVDRCARAGR